MWISLSAIRLNTFIEENPPPTWNLNHQNGQPAPRIEPIERNQPALERSPAPNPEVTQQSYIDEIYRRSLDKAHAWQFQVGAQKVLANNIKSPFVHTFSRDGESITFVQEERGAFAIKIVRLRDHSLIESWIPSAEPLSMDWSEDGKRLAYSAQDSLHIVNWESKKDIALPVQFRGFWTSPNQLSSDTFDTLDLDTLGITYANSNLPTFQLQEQFYNEHPLPRKHPHAMVFFGYGDSIKRRIGPYLCIGERDGSWSRALLNNFHDGLPFSASPDLRHILVLENNVLTHYYMTTRGAPEMIFKIDLTGRDFMTPKKLAEVMEQYVDEKQTFTSKVYAKLVNPLNGKVIGPDPKRYKGEVVLTSLRDRIGTVKTLTEIEKIEVGDIASDWSASLGGYWFTLEKVVISETNNSFNTSLERILKEKNGNGPSVTLRNSYAKNLDLVIGSRWKLLVDAPKTGNTLAIGTITIGFAVTAKGQIERIRVIKNTSNAAFAKLCERAVAETTLADVGIPASEILENGLFDHSITFNLN